MSKFVVFEGIDGAGKSTQIRRCIEWFEEAGQQVVSCRDPGTTEIGERLRRLAVEGQGVDLGPECETLVYMAARAQLVTEIIRPALESGKTVVSDRYLLSNVVYQGHGFGFDCANLWRIGEFATGGCLPDLTFILDIDPNRATTRRRGKADRMEQRDVDYFLRLRRGFLTEAERYPDSMVVVDADQTEQEVQAAIRKVLRERCR